MDAPTHPRMPARKSIEVPTAEELFEAHVGFVWRVLRSLGVPASDLEDASQEVFLVVHRKRATFEGRSSIRTWLYGICVRTASDRRRRASVRREIATADPPELEAKS